MADGSGHFAFTQAVESATASLWEKASAHATPLEWRLQAPLIAEINRLKREKNAVILAHNYMTPEIFHGVGDFVGDSLGLAREAARSDAAVIVQAMAVVAGEAGLAPLVAPIRPTWKDRYPLTAIARYATWKRPDGLPFDPWLRLHHRLGGSVLRSEPQLRASVRRFYRTTCEKTVGIFLTGWHGRKQDWP